MKKVMLFLSVFAILLFLNLDLENKNFNGAGNIFSGASSKVQNRKDSNHINLTDNFWTSGRFNF